MQYGFVVIAWLLMSGTAPVPFASMDACEAAAKELKGRQVCVGTGAFDALAIIKFAMSMEDDRLPNETTVKYSRELFESGLLNEHQREVVQQLTDGAKKHRREETGPLESGITAGGLDAIKRHIEPCWNLPSGARDAQNMVIEIRATLGPDGRVRSATIADRIRARDDTL